jgi:hypothetical protein
VSALSHGHVLRSGWLDQHSARLDAEEWRDLVGAYLDAGSAAVTEMGGRRQEIGRRLMSLFAKMLIRARRN